MELTRNILMTAEEKCALADKAIEMIEEIKDQKNHNIIAKFGSTSAEVPHRSIHDLYLEIPTDIVGIVIEKFKSHGWFVFFNGDCYEVHKRRLGYNGEYV